MAKLNRVARRVALSASLALVAAFAIAIPLKPAAAEDWRYNGHGHGGYGQNWGQNWGHDWRHGNWDRYRGGYGGYGGYGGGAYFSYNAPSYYYAPPTYYYAPPVYYAPPPVYYPPAPVYGPPALSLDFVFPLRFR